MKISKRQLRRIIKEEKMRILKEGSNKPSNYAVGYNTSSSVKLLHKVLNDEMVRLTGDPHWDEDPENVEVVHAWLNDLKALTSMLVGR